MIRFLAIVQDLRISGTSEGIVSRSFLAKLRTSYPDAIIDVVYIKTYERKDRLDLLPVNNIKTYLIDLKIPFFTKFINRFYWRIFHESLNDKHLLNKYTQIIKNIDHLQYDHVFIRSAGIEHEMILASKDLPILKKAFINFHDPFPLFWYAGSKSKFSFLELYRLKNMCEVVQQAKGCSSPAQLLSNDLEHLYGSRKKFYTYPHQFSASVFDFSDNSQMLKKSKKVTISYHGAIMFGRNIEIVLDAYQELVEENAIFKNETELICRLKGVNLKMLQEKYKTTGNIILLDTLNFANSSNEQMQEADLLLILENGPLYSNTLMGKAPFLADLKKPILTLSPQRSEIRGLIKDDKYIAAMDDKSEIKIKLKNLIVARLDSKIEVFPFGDYFSDENFKTMLDEVLKFEPLN